MRANVLHTSNQWNRVTCFVVAALCVGHAVGVRGQAAEIRLVAGTAPSPSDITTTLPPSETFFLNDAGFVVEIWGQTSDPNGLSSVSADITFGATLASVTGITHFLQTRLQLTL